MASVSRRVLFYTRRCPSQISLQYTTTRYAPQWQRPLSTTTHLRADEPTKESSVTATAAEPPNKILEQLNNAATAQSENAASSSSPGAPPLSRAARELAKIVADLKALDPEAVQEAIRKGRQDIPLVREDDELETDEDFDVTEDKGKAGFWAEGEESMGPDEDYFADDLTSLGHGELEKHRELREYARLIAWELPLLSQLARPFEPPTTATPFRFRYTSYLGERHPAVNKVVVEFTASDMNLLPTQRDKLIKLAGVRYNPDTDIIKMSCEQFDTQTQNKRFLGETIEKLLAEAKDGKDTFADVPFDFRHHKPKVKHEFPKEWILTPERKKYLEEKRAESFKLDDQKLNNGLLIDGQKVIETNLPFTAPMPEPAMVGGARGRALR
ncbi:hypothetical protein CC80DRAFT_539280 [Byssothecium circinans]|uniref:Small ribosomal subunit protein mS35 mitochondrial conserved domain-containing protein n=1 Tax=Byssothecium circinans TaxID=147558 RepID=A0A6A5TE76_9PLEO|nr:hypothetical protein CC80DRAFT_539280 [Byssothecium circinans]